MNLNEKSRIFHQHLNVQTENCYVSNCLSEILKMPAKKEKIIKFAVNHLSILFNAVKWVYCPFFDIKHRFLAPFP